MTIIDRCQDSDPSPPLKKANGNGNGNHNIISLINHYSAFHETIEENSATGTPPYTSQPPIFFEIRQNFPDVSFPATAVIETKVPKQEMVIAVIPAYNEELVIGTVVLQTMKHVDHVIVVDDGSTDRTSQVAALAGAEVITLPENKGKGFAVFTGFARARQLKCSAVVMLDGDGQHDPDEIPVVVAPVIARLADMVIGSRALNGTRTDIPSYRRLGQKTLDMATNMSSSFKTTDSQSGFRALSCSALKMIDFTSDGYNIETDMIARLSEKGLTITEVSINVRYDVPHKHKKNPFTHGMDIASHIVGFIGYRRPLLSFGIPGTAILIMGLGIGSYAFQEYYLTSRFSFMASMGSAVLLIMGLLLVTTALILNSLVQVVKMGKA